MRVTSQQVLRIRNIDTSYIEKMVHIQKHVGKVRIRRDDKHLETIKNLSMSHKLIQELILLAVESPIKKGRSCKGVLHSK